VKVATACRDDNEQEANSVDMITERASKGVNPAERKMRTRRESSASKEATLAVASLATALVLIIFTVPLTTLSSTAQALGAGAGAQGWILSAMSVGAASALLGSGAMGDDYGRRRTFVAGTVVLALASCRALAAGPFSPAVWA
jgi:MFS family permease